MLAPSIAALPHNTMFSPTFVPALDGRPPSLFYIKPSALSGTSELYKFDATSEESARVMAPVAGGDTEANLSLEEKLRRERTRQVSTGITSFAVSRDTQHTVYPQGGNVMLVAPGASSASEVVKKGAAGAALDARPSPDGRMVAFVLEGELFVAPLEDGGGARAVQVSRGSRENGWTSGLADYLAAEEFDRQSGFWWSPDSRYLAYQRTDDLNVPELRIVHSGAEPASSTSLESHRYPFAGAANPTVRLAIADVGGIAFQSAASSLPSSAAQDEGNRGPPPPTVWLHCGEDSDIYVSRVQWAAAAGAASASSSASSPPLLLVQLLNREQTVLDVVAFSPTSPTAELLLREEVEGVDGWLNTHDCLHVLPETSVPGLSTVFLWASERSGFQHLYLYGVPLHASAASVGGVYGGVPKSPTRVRAGRAALLGAVTSGAWVVESVAAVTAAAAAAGIDPASAPTPAADASNFFTVYCSGTLDSPLQRHLYAVPLRVVSAETCVYGEPVRVTTGPGMHTVVMSEDGRLMADTLSSLMGPPSLTMWRVEASVGCGAGGGAGTHTSSEKFGTSSSPSSASAAAPEPMLSSAAAASSLSSSTGTSVAAAGGAVVSPPSSSAASASASFTTAHLFDFVSGVSSVLGSVVRFGGVGGYGTPVENNSRSDVAAAHNTALTLSVSAHMVGRALHGALPPSDAESAEEPASYGRHVAALHAIARARSGVSGRVAMRETTPNAAAAAASSTSAAGAAAAAVASFASKLAKPPAYSSSTSTSLQQQQQQHAHPHHQQKTPLAAPPPPPSSSFRPAAMGDLLRGTFASMSTAAKGVAKEVGSSLTEAAKEVGSSWTEAVEASAAFIGLAPLPTPATSAPAVDGGRRPSGTAASIATGKAVATAAPALSVVVAEAVAPAVGGDGGDASAATPTGILLDSAAELVRSVQAEQQQEHEQQLQQPIAAAASTAFTSPTAMTPVPGGVELSPSFAVGDAPAASPPGISPSASATVDSLVSVAAQGSALVKPKSAVEQMQAAVTQIQQPPPAPAAVNGGAVYRRSPVPCPLIVRLLAADGVTEMYAALFLPDSVEHGTGPYPTIIR